MAFLRKIVLGMIALAAIGLAGFFIFAPKIAEKGKNAVIAHDPYPVSTRAKDLHASLTIGDWHADSLLWNRDLLKRADYGQVDFPRLAEGNVALQMFTTVTKSPADFNYETNATDARDNITLLAFGQLWPVKTWQNLTERALYQSKRLHDFQAESPDTFRIIRTKSDLNSVLADRAAGKPVIGAMLGAEGGHALEADISNLAQLDAAGFRMIGLTHFFDNALGGSLHGQSGAGLTKFGRAVVVEMEARNIIVDLAHTSQQMARDVLAMATKPVIVSHTGIHGHCKVKRNFPDDLMKEIAAKGGLIAIGYWKDVTCDPTPDGVAATIKAAIRLLGAEHVALGSDYDGSVETAFDTSELAALTDALLRANVTETDIALVMGGNMVSFLKSALPD